MFMAERFYALKESAQRLALADFGRVRKRLET